MFKQDFPLPDSFHVATVQVATVWTNPESTREIDQPGIANPTNIEKWLAALSNEEKVALCNDNRVQTQLLYGEIAVVTEIEGEWAKVTIPSQPSKKDSNGYPGWVPLKQLQPVSKTSWIRPETAVIREKHAWLENESGEKLLKLSYMTCLPVVQVKGDRVEVMTPDGSRFLPKQVVEIFPTDKGGPKGNGDSMIEATEAYVGLQYLWGGMSSFGMIALVLPIICIRLMVIRLVEMHPIKLHLARRFLLTNYSLVTYYFLLMKKEKEVFIMLDFIMGMER